MPKKIPEKRKNNTTKALKRKVDRLYRGIERKFFDKSISGPVASGSSRIDALSEIPQGDTGETRDGMSINIYASQLRLSCNMNAAATATQFRVLLVEDRQPNASIPNVNEVLDSDSVIANANMHNRRRFRIHIDKQYNLDINGRRSIYIKKYTVFKPNRKAVYEPTGSGNLPSSGSMFYLIQMSSESTNTPQVDWNHRIRFTDL